MKLSKDQVPLFWKLWAKACRAQGWTKADGLNSAAVDAKRKEFLAGLGRFECVECHKAFHIGGKFELPASGRCGCGAAIARMGFTSLTLVDPWEDFSLVKRELLKLDDQLGGALDQVKKSRETGRKGRWFIDHAIFPCIALYADVDAVLNGLAQDYKFTWKMDLMRGEPFTLDDLSDDPIIKTVKGQPREFPSQVKQLTMSLAAILNGKNGLRATAGDSVHDMRLHAGLECDCEECQRSAVMPAAEPVHAAGAAEVFDPDKDPF